MRKLKLLITLLIMFGINLFAQNEKLPIPEMVFIKGGTFQMGSNDGKRNEKPVHSVTISNFYMSKYEVTFAEYDVFCEATGLEKPHDEGWGRGNHPVINVSWNDAVAYCKWLSKETGKNYSLPTESEWEYVAGGGRIHQKWAGTNNEKTLTDYAFYGSNAEYKTHPVGSKKPNRFGLYDMSGNVWEWCSDWYGVYPNSLQKDPKGGTSGSDRVNRGGGCYVLASYCRVTERRKYRPSFSGSNLGFRVVLR